MKAIKPKEAANSMPKLSRIFLIIIISYLRQQLKWKGGDNGK
jgi:hypothetical protein